MRILFLTRRAWPKIGGVEKHIRGVSKVLESKGHKITIISEDNIKYPHVKFLGILFIWYWLLSNRRLIKNADVVHCHDVFIWYLPFRLFYPRKKCVATIHGLEWDFPLRKSSLFIKKLTIKLANRTVAVGEFLEKYLKAKFDLVTYGATNIPKNKNHIKREEIVYVGRLEANTGLLNFLSWLSHTKNTKAIFCGDGVLRGMCEKYGKVYGFTNPDTFTKKAKYCVPGGYLAALEALNAGCELKLFWNNKIKEDYWKMSPFVKKEAKVWARKQTWNKLANEYLNLYNSI